MVLSRRTSKDRNKEKGQSISSQDFQVAQKQRRQIILESSNAVERHAEWRKTKVFVDHKWVDRIQV